MVENYRPEYFLYQNYPIKKVPFYKKKRYIFFAIVGVLLILILIQVVRIIEQHNFYFGEQIRNQEPEQIRDQEQRVLERQRIIEEGERRRAREEEERKEKQIEEEQKQTARWEEIARQKEERELEGLRWDLDQLLLQSKENFISFNVSNLPSSMVTKEYDINRYDKVATPEEKILLLDIKVKVDLLIKYYEILETYDSSNHILSQKDLKIVRRIFDFNLVSRFFFEEQLALYKNLNYDYLGLVFSYSTDIARIMLSKDTSFYSKFIAYEDGDYTNPDVNKKILSIRKEYLGHE